MEGKRLRLTLPYWSEAELVIATVPPSWGVLSECKLDDAVVGPHGKWERARDFVPLFALCDGYLVATIAALHAVGFFAEGNWSEAQEVSTAASSRSGTASKHS